MNDNKFHATITVKTQFGEINGHQVSDQNDMKCFMKMVDALYPITQLTNDFAANYAEPEIEEAPAEPAPEAVDADQAVMDNWLKTAFKIQLSRNDLLDAVEVFPRGKHTSEIVKQRAIGIVRRELQEHHPNDIVNRSTKKWLEVKRCGPQVVTFIRAALFNLRKLIR